MKHSFIYKIPIPLFLSSIFHAILLIIIANVSHETLEITAGVSQIEVSVIAELPNASRNEEQATENSAPQATQNEKKLTNNIQNQPNSIEKAETSPESSLPNLDSAALNTDSTFSPRHEPTIPVDLYPTPIQKIKEVSETNLQKEESSISSPSLTALNSVTKKNPPIPSPKEHQEIHEDGLEKPVIPKNTTPVPHSIAVPVHTPDPKVPPLSEQTQKITEAKPILVRAPKKPPHFKPSKPQILEKPLEKQPTPILDSSERPKKEKIKPILPEKQKETLKASKKIVEKIEKVEKITSLTEKKTKKIDISKQVTSNKASNTQKTKSEKDKAIEKNTNSHSISQATATIAHGQETNSPNNSFQSAQYQIGSSGNPKPKYPSIAQKRGWEGRVILTVFIDKKGNVTDIKILKSSGRKILDRTAKKTVKKWRFKPAQQAGIATSSELNIPIRFNLKDL